MNVNEVISNRAIELARRHARQQEAGPPQRRRQHVAVVERHVPDRDAHRRRRGGRRTADPSVTRAARARSTRKAEAVDRRRQDRPHASAGRGAADASARNGRGCAAQLGRRRSSASSRACRGSTSSRSAAPRSAPASTRPRVSPRTSPAEIADADRAAVRHRAQQVRRAGLARRDGSRRTARCATLAVALMKIANDMRWLASGPRCGLGELTAARATSRARRSCPARSTRPSARR